MLSRSIKQSWDGLRYHQEKVLHVDMRFFLNMHVGKNSHVDMEKSHVNMRFFPNMSFWKIGVQICYMHVTDVNMHVEIFLFPIFAIFFPTCSLLYVDIQAFTRNMNGLWWSTQCRTVWQSGIRPRPPQRQSGIRPRPPQSLGHKRPPGPCPTSQGQTSPGACQTPQTLHLELTNSSLAILCAGPPVCALPPHQAALTCMSKSICNMHVGVCKMHVGICYIHVGFCNMHVGICKMHVGIGYVHVGFCNMHVGICNLSTCLSPHGRWVRRSFWICIK